MGPHDDVDNAEGWLRGASVARLVAMVTAARPLTVCVADSSLEPSSVRSLTHRMAMLEHGAEQILVPVNSKQNHWVLAAVPLAASRQPILLFDSIRGRTDSHSLTAQQSINSYLVKLRQIFADLGCEVPLSISSPMGLFLDAECPQQNKAGECGIALVVSALHLAVGRFLPLNTDYALWRKTFSYVLADTDNSTWPAMLPTKDFSPVNPEPIKLDLPTIPAEATADEWRRICRELQERNQTLMRDLAERDRI